MRELGRPLDLTQRIVEQQRSGAHRQRATDTAWVFVGTFIADDDPGNDPFTDTLSPPFENGENEVYDGSDGENPLASFFIDPNGICNMRGSINISGLTSPVVLYYLPIGYRPEYNVPLIWRTDTLGVFAEGLVRAEDGAVVLLSQGSD